MDRGAWRATVHVAWKLKMIFNVCESTWKTVKFCTYVSLICISVVCLRRIGNSHQVQLYRQKILSLKAGRSFFHSLIKP